MLGRDYAWRRLQHQHNLQQHFQCDDGYRITQLNPFGRVSEQMTLFLAFLLSIFFWSARTLVGLKVFVSKQAPVLSRPFFVLLQS